jgi:hypothetical protein
MIDIKDEDPTICYETLGIGYEEHTLSTKRYTTIHTSKKIHAVLILNPIFPKLGLNPNGIGYHSKEYLLTAVVRSQRTSQTTHNAFNRLWTSLLITSRHDLSTKRSS